VLYLGNEKQEESLGNLHMALDGGKEIYFKLAPNVVHYSCDHCSGQPFYYPIQSLPSVYGRTGRVVELKNSSLQRSGQGESWDLRISSHAK